MKYVACLAFLFVAGICHARYGYPVGVKTCPEDQPDVNACRQDALQQAVPLLAAGIPNIGAGPADPMDHLPPLVWKGNSRGINVKFQLNNARISGHGDSIVDDLQVDVEKNRIHVQAHVPGEFILEGAYILEGEILGVPLKGNGKFKSVMVGAGVDATYQGHLAKGPGKQAYLQLDSTTVKLSVGKSSYEFGGLFGDYGPLAQAGNLFINKVAAPIVERELMPSLEEWLGTIYQQKAQAVFSTVPYNVLFPRTEEI